METTRNRLAGLTRESVVPRVLAGDSYLQSTDGARYSPRSSPALTEDAHQMSRSVNRVSELKTPGNTRIWLSAAASVKTWRSQIIVGIGLDTNQTASMWNSARVTANQYCFQTGRSSSVVRIYNKDKKRRPPCSRTRWDIVQHLALWVRRVFKRCGNVGRLRFGSVQEFQVIASC